MTEALKKILELELGIIANVLSSVNNSFCHSKKEIENVIEVYNKLVHKSHTAEMSGIIDKGHYDQLKKETIDKIDCLQRSYT